jgi:carbon-monoxide dehydrogenase large subunit
MAGSILGTRVLRSEDPRFLRGDGRYMANIAPANAVHVTYVRSHFAHARIRSIDVTAASTAPGVVGVFTAAAVDALSHLGVRHIDMPLTPKEVWWAIESADR